MTRDTFVWRNGILGKRSPRRSTMTQRVLVVSTLMLAASSASAQQSLPPAPYPAATVGTIGLDGTVDKFYSTTHQAIVKTADGVRHLVHLTDRTAVHGTRAAEDSFGELEEGSHVVVHYVTEGDRKTALEIDRVGDGGLSLIEGTVKHIDRAGKTLTIQLADGSANTLRLTERAARDVGKNVKRGRVIVYYSDEGGERVAHYFKRTQ
jgi:hypothetical protein